MSGSFSYCLPCISSSGIILLFWRRMAIVAGCVVELFNHRHHHHHLILLAMWGIFEILCRLELHYLNVCIRKSPGLMLEEKVNPQPHLVIPIRALCFVDLAVRLVHTRGPLYRMNSRIRTIPASISVIWLSLHSYKINTISTSLLLSVLHTVFSWL